MIAYLDCFSGVSGDMLLGALVDAGLSIDRLRAGLGALPLGGYTVEARAVTRANIAATKVDVQVTQPHPQRGPNEIASLIEAAALPGPVKELSGRIVARLAQAEATVHRQPIETVHFHELGAVDTIIDVVGAAFGLHALGVERVYCSPLNVGHGRVRTAHGDFPVPAPATLRLLEGVPIYDSGVEAELVTPTGAAIVSTVAESFGVVPPMRLRASGCGAGGKDLASPNVVRILLGEAGSEVLSDRVVLLETNIDDMNPELYEHVSERLFQTGALDVFLVAIQMKKNRPAVLLSAIAPIERAEELARIVLEETSSLGVRFREMRRICLPRSVEIVTTTYGPIRVKVAHRSGGPTAAPEYEDCRRAAREHHVPLMRVYEAAQRAWASEAGKGEKS